MDYRENIYNIETDYSSALTQTNIDNPRKPAALPGLILSFA
jgi:hypothetical protein